VMLAAPIAVPAFARAIIAAAAGGRFSDLHYFRFPG
jgi:hypothetical protein